MNSKIRSFEDLNAWKEGHKLVIMIYTVTKSFPKEEIFGLTSQMRRATVSITSNIAEGFSRKSAKEKIQFYTMSAGSLTELQSQLLISRDVGYIANLAHEKINEQLTKVHKILSGLIKGAESWSLS